MNYVKDFVRYNRNNEVGFGLFLTAVVVTGLYVSIGVAVANTGMVITVGWWASIPVGLWMVTVTHFVLRPIVSRKFN